MVVIGDLEARWRFPGDKSGDADGLAVVGRKDGTTKRRDCLPLAMIPTKALILVALVKPCFEA